MPGSRCRIGWRAEWPLYLNLATTALFLAVGQDLLEDLGTPPDSLS
jgi:hypothetical protein